MNVLLPGEQLVQQFICTTKKRDSSFPVTLTNFRLILEDQGSTNEIISYKLSDIQDLIPKEVKGAGEANLFLVKIQLKDKESRILRFENKETMESFTILPKSLNNLLKEESLVKFQVLLDNPELIKLYNSLVVNGLMTDNEFWQNRPEIKDFNNLAQSLDQNLGKIAKPVHRPIIIYEGDKKKVPELTIEEKHKLLRRETRLFKQYQELVENGKKTSEEFWKTFMDLQIKNDTVLVGGINKIFLEGKEENKEMGEEEFEKLIEKKNDLNYIYEFSIDPSEKLKGNSLNEDLFNGGNVDLIKIFNSKNAALINQEESPKEKKTMEIEEPNISQKIQVRVEMNRVQANTESRQKMKFGKGPYLDPFSISQKMDQILRDKGRDKSIIG